MDNGLKENSLPILEHVRTEVTYIKQNDCRFFHSVIFFQRKSEDANYSALILLPLYIV